MLASATGCFHNSTPQADADLSTSWQELHATLHPLSHIKQQWIITLLLGTLDKHSPLHRLHGNSHVLEQICSIVCSALAQPTTRTVMFSDPSVGALQILQWNDQGPIAFCLGDKSAEWTPLAEMLSVRGMRVVIPVVPFNDRDDPFEWEWLRILEELVESYGVEQCCLCATGVAAQMAGRFAAPGCELLAGSESVQNKVVQRLLVVEPVGDFGDLHKVHPYIRCPVLACWRDPSDNSRSFTVWRMRAQYPGSSMIQGQDVLVAPPEELLNFLLPPAPPPQGPCALM